MADLAAMHHRRRDQLVLAGSPCDPIGTALDGRSGQDWATAGLLATKLVASGEDVGGEAFLAPSQVKGLRHLDILGQAGQAALGGHVVLQVSPMPAYIPGTCHRHRQGQPGVHMILSVASSFANMSLPARATSATTMVLLARVRARATFATTMVLLAEAEPTFATKIQLGHRALSSAEMAGCSGQHTALPRMEATLKIPLASRMARRRKLALTTSH